MSNEDTDVLLASLISLLEPNVPSNHEYILNTLVDCNGDIHAAARLIQMSSNIKGSSTIPGSRKRKREAPGLDGWLSRPEVTSSSRKQSKEYTVTSSPKYYKNPESASSHTSNVESQSKAKKPQSTGVVNTVVSTVKPIQLRAANSSSSAKPVDLMSVLKAPASEKPTIVRNPPLTLSNPSMVAENSPCTLHYSILPPELACELFYTMLDAAQGWSRNKWWLFDRLVESPHRTSFFARLDGSELEGDSGKAWNEAAQFWYNGRKTSPPSPFPEEMEAACKYVEIKVNEELQKRGRFPLEWGGSSGWRANVAAANCYEGTKEGVGFHSDQLTNLGPYPTIASLSLGTTRLFRLREVIPASEINERQARTYNIPLPHNSLIIMHASTQERFKHCVPPQPTIDIFRPPFPRRPIPGASLIELGETSSSNCRINITFRFYRPDFMPNSTPKCNCGVPCILRPDMKQRVDRREDKTRAKGLKPDKGKGNSVKEDNTCHIKYWWTCYSGAQNEEKGCGMWKVMDVKAEGRGPFVGSEPESSST